MAEKGGISVQTEHIFPVIKRWLYSDKEIFLSAKKYEQFEIVDEACTKAKDFKLTGEHVLADGLEHEGFEHVAHQLIVRNGAVSQRTDGQNVAGRASDHAFGFFAEGENIACIAINGHNGGLAQNDALALVAIP